MAFLNDFFFKKLIKEKIHRRQKQHAKLPSMQRGNRCYSLENLFMIRVQVFFVHINPCPAEPGYTLFCKQCRSRSVGFWRSQLIWICTVWHQECKFIATILIKYPDWLKIRSGRGILIHSAGQGLIVYRKQLIFGIVLPALSGFSFVCKGTQVIRKHPFCLLETAVSYLHVSYIQLIVIPLWDHVPVSDLLKQCSQKKRTKNKRQFEI